MCIDKISSNFKMEIKSHKIVDGGQNNILVLVNETFFFRIPRYEAGVKKLKKSLDQMAYIRPHLSLDIPNYVFRKLDGPVGVAMVGYPIIEGQQLLKDQFDILTKHHDTLAIELGTFLKDLHGIEVDRHLFEEVEVCGYYQKMHDEVQTLLFEHMSDTSKKELSVLYETYLKSCSGKTFKKTLTHNDIGPTNILFKEGHISGVIDFDSLCISDPAMDVACMMGPFGYGEEFVRKMNVAYQNIEDLIERARFYRQTFALEDALFGIKNGDEKTFEAGIRPYR